MMGTSRSTASAQLERLLHILPAAARAGGCRLEDLAASLETSVDQVLQDLEEVTARAFYHPAGGADNLQIMIDGDRLRIWSTGAFKRPTKLVPLEACSLALGFRVLAAAQPAESRQELIELAKRLEAQISTASPEAVVDGVAVSSGDRAGGEIMANLRHAATQRLRCRIQYLKMNAAEAETRVIHPYALTRADAGWYTLAFCEARKEVRAFRADRMLRAEVLDTTFARPEDFDPEAWLAAGGRVFRAENEIEVVVRYSARVAPWVREKGPVEELADGGVIVRYQVSDPHWVIRETLSFGPDAEILEPEGCREMIALELERIAGAREWVSMEVRGKR